MMGFEGTPNRIRIIVLGPECLVLILGPLGPRIHLHVGSTPWVPTLKPQTLNPKALNPVDILRLGLRRVRAQDLGRFKV